MFSSNRVRYEAKLESHRFCLVQPCSVNYRLLRQSCVVLSRTRRAPVCVVFNCPRVLSPPPDLITLHLLTGRLYACRNNSFFCQHLLYSDGVMLYPEPSTRIADDTTPILSLNASLHRDKHLSYRTGRRLVCRHNVHTAYYHLQTASSRSLLK